MKDLGLASDDVGHAVDAVAKRVAAAWKSEASSKGYPVAYTNGIVVADGDPDAVEVVRKRVKGSRITADGAADDDPLVTKMAALAEEMLFEELFG